MTRVRCLELHASRAQPRVDRVHVRPEDLGDRDHFFFDDRPSALDVYVACGMNLFLVPPEDRCAMWPPIRQTFESMRGAVPEPPPSILALRDRMYERWLPNVIEV